MFGDPYAGPTATAPARPICSRGGGGAGPTHARRRGGGGDRPAVAEPGGTCALRIGGAAGGTGVTLPRTGPRPHTLTCTLWGHKETPPYLSPTHPPARAPPRPTHPAGCGTPQVSPLPLQGPAVIRGAGPVQRARKLRCTSPRPVLVHHPAPHPHVPGRRPPPPPPGLGRRATREARQLQARQRPRHLGGRTDRASAPSRG